MLRDAASTFLLLFGLLTSVCAPAPGEDPPRSGFVDLSPLTLSKNLLKAGLNAAAVTEINTNLSAKDYAKAEAGLSAGLAASANPQIVLQVLGGVLFLDSKYLDAAIAYKKGEKYGTLPESSRFTLAMSYVELKRNGWAREELTRLNAEKPNQPLYLYWLGRLDYDDQKFADAKANFRKATEADPHFVRGFDGLALCEDAIGDRDAAEENYRTANTLNREQGRHFAWPPLNYGNMLSKASRFAEARLLLKEALAIDPALAKAYYELGRVEEQTSNREAALADFKLASSLDPHDPSPVYAQFRLYKAAGKDDLAAATMARFQNLKSQQSKNTQ